MRIKTKYIFMLVQWNTIPLLEPKDIVYLNKPELSAVSYQISKQNVLVCDTWEMQLDCCTWNWLLIINGGFSSWSLTSLWGKCKRIFLKSFYTIQSIQLALIFTSWYSPVVNQFYVSWCYYSLYEEGRFLSITTLINTNVHCYFCQLFKEMRT